MSYSYVISEVSEKELKNIKAETDCDKIGDMFYKLREIHDLGGDVTAKLDDLIRSKGKPLFDNEMQDYMEYYNPYVVNREVIINIINEYEEAIKTSYIEMFHMTKKELSEEELEKIHGFFRSKVGNFQRSLVDLKDEKQRITTSWKYEYVIFELAYQYKSLKKDSLIIYWGH